MNRDLRALLERRLAAQHLTGPPAASVAGVVRDSLAVQAQDPGLSRWALGMRCGANEPQVLAALSSGEVIRTHVLRGTWHYVHRDDLRWLLQLTSGTVVAGMAARHRQLGIDDRVRDEAFDRLGHALSGGATLTRAELQPLLPASTAGAPSA